MDAPHRLTRAQALALDPGALLEGGLGAGRGEAARVVGPIALFEQLRREGTPIAALEMAIALLHRHSELAILDAATLELLRGELLFAAGEGHGMRAWAAAIGRHLLDRRSIEGALELLIEARQAWLLTDALRLSDPRSVGRSGVGS